ncbi:MAG: hypothetical protein MZW92_18465 [Comamonadaceae bacterium]|nr:hypothetical protein [Comamonadaceae bacterium]
MQQLPPTIRAASSWPTRSMRVRQSRSTCLRAPPTWPCSSAPPTASANASTCCVCSPASAPSRRRSS